jgi:hypothetical protein
MELSDAQIKEYQMLCLKHYGTELAWQEAADGARSMIGLVKLLLDGMEEEQRRKDRLEQEPKGFHLTGIGYSCFVCGQHISNEETWYDKNGIKCLLCQDALNKKRIPAYVCKKKETWYSLHNFQFYFDVKSGTILKLVRQGKLKMRTILNKNGGIHYRLFLIKDNPGVLPQKPRSRLVPTEGNKVTTEYEKVPFPLLEA